MRLFNLVLVLMVLWSSAIGQSAKIYFEQLTTADGLPENSVTAILQDRLGFMWLGTHNGLIRYDGVTMTTFAYNAKDPYSLKCQSINTLYEDRQGNIWIGCVGGLFRFEQRTQRFIAYSPKGNDAFIPEDIVRFIYQDKTGNFWIITQHNDINTLNQLDPTTNTWTHYRHEPGTINSLAFNNILIMSATGVKKACLLEDKSGVIWVVATKGSTSNSEATLHQYDRIHDCFKPYYPRGIDAASPLLRYIKSPQFDRRGMLWVPTNGHGLFRINPITNQIIAHYRHSSTDRRSLVSDSLRTVYEDRSGYIWLSTFYGLDRLDPKTSLFRHFPSDPNNNRTPHHMILDAEGESANGNIWFFTNVGGLDEYDQKTGLFTRYTINFGRPGEIVGSRTPSFLIDHTGLVWVGTMDKGLNKQSRMTRFSLFDYRSDGNQRMPSQTASVIYEAPSDATVRWVGTTQGLDRYDKKTGQTTHFALDLKNPSAFGSDKVTSMTEDAKGRFWIGTTNGFYLMDRQRGVFTQFTHKSTDANQLNNKLVKALLAAKDGSLWVGTDFGLNQYNPETKRFTYYYKVDTTYHPALFRFFLSINKPARRIAAAWHTSTFLDVTTAFSLSEPTTLAVSVMGTITLSRRNDYGWIEDASGRKVWDMSYLHTRDAGGNGERLQIDTIRLPAGRYRLLYKGEARIAQSTFNLIPPTPYYPELWGIQVLRISHTEADSLSRLTKKWIFNGLSGSSIRSLHQDKKGNIWIGTANGGLNRFVPHTGQFTHYYQSQNGLVNVSAIYEDPKGNIWLGDYIRGLFVLNPQTGHIRRYTTADGLSHNSVMGIQADEQGQLWLNTYNGISRFDPTTQRFRTYTTANGLGGMVFRYPSFKNLDGTLFFLGDHGISTLARNQLYDDPQPPRVVLTDVDIFNHKALIGPAEPLQKHISIADKLTLAHNQNDVTLHFAALHYSRSGECRYAVQLEPYDKDWVDMGTARQVRYTSLLPGTYIFRVKAANADGVWNPKGTTIQVTVSSPWWSTWWACMLYAFGLAGLMVGFIRYRVRQGHQQQEVAFQKREAKRLLALDELKTRFFSNITHELRTPLTLIIAPTETLLQDKNLTAPIRRSLNTVQRNARQLLQLINQLLDLSKLEAGSMTVTEFRGDVIEFVNQQIELFQNMADQKQIALAVDVNDLRGEYVFDAAKWERILNNLLSNAIKFTPEQGSVTVTLRKPFPDRIEMAVRDTGIGIPAKEQPHIFDRFYQVDDSRTRAQAGTGIGLALVKELTDLLGGFVQVNSEVNRGTQVVVSLPIRKSDGQEYAGNLVVSEGLVTPFADPTALLVNDLNQNRAFVLVVEDHTELREFIRECLSDEFRILTAANGEEGWQLAQQEVPDVVISDLMMPMVDGYELCQWLKTNPATDHIAVVLLTARSTQESRLEGLLHGADEYLTKPFSSLELQVRIRNIVAHQQKLRDHYTLPLSASTKSLKSESVTNPYLQKVYSILEDRLDDSAFGVDELASSLAMSRRTLHRKLATLLNLSASDLIQQYRMKRAAELLLEGHPVSQTAYQVGFESPQYFAKVFKDFYQYTPTEFSHRS